MTFTDYPVIGPAVDWHQAGRAQWADLDPRTQARAKVVLLIATTLCAYHYSLGTLAQTVTSDTPLAYLGLVPLLALGLAWFNRKPRGYEPPIHDRQLDYSIGLPLVIVPLIAAYVLPGRLGAMVWVNRLDLLFLPFFVTGATILLFGVRVAWRQKVALLFLLLAWPWPYTSLLLGTLGGFRNATLQGLQAALNVFPVATPVGNAATATVFQVVHNGRAFPISIVTACSGIDSMVGFLLIGIALASIARGPAIRKAVWLACGLVLLWSLNLVRLLLIFWVGRIAGAPIALGVLHPIAGLVFFALGMVILVAILRPLGLQLPTGDPGPAAASPPTASPAPHVFLAAAVLLAVAVLLSGGNTRLRYFDPVANAAGEPRLSSFLARPAAPAGWTPAFETEYPSSKTLFGSSSRWFRYLYSPTDPRIANLHSTLPITADVVDAGGLGGFSAYGITACYSFHGYTLHNVAAVQLRDGINGQALSYAGGESKQDWSIVWWIWPVRTGDGTRYERVVLSLQNTSAGKVVAPASATISRSVDAVDQRLAVNRAFLIAFGREIVSAQGHHHDYDVHVPTLASPGSEHATWLASTAVGPGGKRLAEAAPVNAAATHAAAWRKYHLRHPAPSAVNHG